MNVEPCVQASRVGDDRGLREEIFTTSLRFGFSASINHLTFLSACCGEQWTWTNPGDWHCRACSKIVGVGSDMPAFTVLTRATPVLMVLLERLHPEFDIFARTLIAAEILQASEEASERALDTLGKQHEARERRRRREFGNG